MAWSADVCLAGLCLPSSFSRANNDQLRQTSADHAIQQGKQNFLFLFCYWIDNGITEPTRDDYIFHIEFNHFHDYGLGVLSDYGAVYIGGQPKHNCITSSEEIVRKYCFSYIHIYNNLINDARSFTNGGTFLYSDAGKKAMKTT